MIASCDGPPPSAVPFESISPARRTALSIQGEARSLQSDLKTPKLASSLLHKQLLLLLKGNNCLLLGTL